MKKLIVSIFVLTLALMGRNALAANPYVGAWQLTLPTGGAGWLGVEEKNGQLSASLLWGGGSVLPLASAKVEGDTLIVTRVQRSEKKDAAGKVTKVENTEIITAQRDGDALKCTIARVKPDGKAGDAQAFTGVRQPPLPARPDLSKVKFGAPVSLFNGKDLTGWRKLKEADESAWSVKDGVLNNNPIFEPGKPRKHYANIRTDAEFTDFNLTTEISVPEKGNSGIYLRGIYEVQVADTFGKPVDSHNMGALYSRITPAVAAEKPAGEWQTMNITLVDRHLTVILNGKTIIDNQPVAGCTGGALWSDVTKPGPIYLQGDHTGVNYRNMVLRPVVK